ncbi:hypothetical protein [Actinoplanes sp. NBRC 103695]|uniref:COG1470 family protein n=1 Tax=Actinoplanes sp. NBRC 103695 TaxID=3032202 RepID=UPI0024A18EBE|nr:hypothetical protein [Actinoplanes sp. NBRC 103695]GLZ00405.1 hypothetical protein Acsp02_76570 [Actinoplanes sp. NBRC 103695]
MTLELTLQPTPVALAPGVATRVPVQLHNRNVAPITVRVGVARGRASGWASVEPPDVVVGAGDTETVDVVLAPPADQPPSASMVPFTVQATEHSTGEPAGFTTGLLTVAVPIPVVGTMVERPRATTTYDLTLTNEGPAAAPVRIKAELDPPAGTISAAPQAVRLEPGESVTVVIKAKPSRPFMGTPRPFFVVAAILDADDPDRPPLLTRTARGKRKPRVATWAAATTAIVLALGATAAVAFSGLRIPLPGGRRDTPAAKAPAPAAVTVARPYALIDVFPHKGDDGGRGAAEAARRKLADAGMPVKLVDSLQSNDLADQGTGFWVLLQDGFAGVEAAQQYCTQWKPVAPKCTVTP